MSPFSNTTAELTDENFKWTLYGRKRPISGKRYVRYSDGLKSILSVKRSTLPGAGLGCFAEKTFTYGDIISVYLGEKLSTNDSDTHNELPYALRVDRYTTLNPSGSDLLLGAHKCNNTKCCPPAVSPHGSKMRGGQVKNNAYFEGIYLKAGTSILIGNEIFADYAPHSESIKKLT